MSQKASTSSASSPKKRFGPKSSKSKSKSNQPISYSAGPVPQFLYENQALNAAITTLLPLNYKFEIHKTIHHVNHFGATCVALQMPEGLTLWATAIADIIETFTNATTVIMGDVTYGACCVDDYTAMALGCDMLVHYGHSCLVPVDQTMIRTLYIFVEITVDSPHLSSTIRSNFPSKRSDFRRKILGIGKNQENEESNGKEKGKEKEIIRRRIEIQTEGNHDNSIESRFKETLNLNEKFSSDEYQEPERIFKNQDNNDDEDGDETPTHFALVATVQFIGALQGLRESLERFEPRPIPKSQRDENSSSNRLMIEDDNSNEKDSKGSDPETSTSSSSTTPWYSSPYTITVPQSKPLSPGEVLGCTSPKFSSSKNDTTTPPDALIYLGDGRFHLESAMIANPRLPAFRYDPYSKTLVRERYDHERMRKERGKALDLAKESVGKENQFKNSREEKELEMVRKKELERRRETRLKKVEKDLMEGRIKLNENDQDQDQSMKEKENSISSKSKSISNQRENSWGLILGTLGRQGSLKVLNHLQDSLILPSSSPSTPNQSQPQPQFQTSKTNQIQKKSQISSIPILLSELSPQKLSLFGPNISIFVQTSCPRLSIDWGDAFDKPLLSPYEATVALGRIKGWDRSDRIKGLGTKKGEKESKNVGKENEIFKSNVEVEGLDGDGDGDYPMDFYSDDSKGPWTPRFGMGIKKKDGIGKNTFLLKKRNRNKEANELVT